MWAGVGFLQRDAPLRRCLEAAAPWRTKQLQNLERLVAIKRRRCYFAPGCTPQLNRGGARGGSG